MKLQKNLKKYLLLILMLSLASNVFSDDEYNLEQLEILRSQNRLSAEDYEILKSELLGTLGQDGEALYSLTINRRYRNNLYRIERVGGINYFPLFEFFQIMGFKNYTASENRIEMTLGKKLFKNEINFNNNTIKISRLNESFKFNQGDIFTKSSEVYIESELFKKLFLNSFTMDEKKYSISMDLYFASPDEIDKMLENTLDNFAYNQKPNQLLFSNDNSLFDLGYAQIVLNGTADKNRGESLKKDWNGYLEYQSGFLYGELTTGYDLKDNLVKDTYIYYPDLYKQHSFEIGSYGTKKREWGISFRKEYGYYYLDKEIVIRENVPIGSRVELLYLGFPIAIQESDNGVVEFRNDEIKNNRVYTLKIYTPEGQIYTVDVNTSYYSKHQNRGQFEYDFRAREDHSSGKYRGEGNIYYGITESLTLSGGVSREIISSESGESYNDLFTGELIWNNRVFRHPYTLIFGTQHGKDDQNQKYLMSRLDLGSFTFISSHVEYGRYYDNYRNEKYHFAYSGSGYNASYDYYIDKNWDGEREHSYDINLSLYNNIMRDLLITTDYNTGRGKTDSYSLNLYYTGFYLFNGRLNTKFSNDGKDYTSTLTIMNKNLWESIDFSLEGSYSNRGESRLTFRFDINYNNWFNGGLSGNRESQQYRMGINKTVDLRDVTQNIEAVNSSRVKVITFIDGNDNNRFDEGEKKLDNVEVKIGAQTLVTDDNGEAMFFGVPNNLAYNIKPVIRKPGYSLGDNSITVNGRKTGTIHTYIPIKPMVTLTGVIVFDDELNLDDFSKQSVYEQTLIKVKDERGTVIESTVAESDGTFQISGLFTKKYTLDIVYLGNRFNIPALTEDIKLVYNDSDSTKMVIKMDERGIAINRGGQINEH